jgi:hypothetical protein
VLKNLVGELLQRPEGAVDLRWLGIAEREDWGRGYMPTSTAEFLDQRSASSRPSSMTAWCCASQFDRLHQRLGTPDEIYPRTR